MIGTRIKSLLVAMVGTRIKCLVEAMAGTRNVFGSSHGVNKLFAYSHGRNDDIPFEPLFSTYSIYSRCS